MGIHSITGPAMKGIQSGIHGLRRVASEIASQPADPKTKPTDLTRAMVEMQQHTVQTKSSLKVLKTSDDMLGTLVDERA
ncbi:MAG: hydrolase [Gammaproteobacteria bacterium]|nr:hydrolase [Gammaproteobacteria bacterium]